MIQSINKVKRSTVRIFTISLLLVQSMNLFGMEETPIQKLKLLFSDYPKQNNNFVLKHYVKSILFTFQQDKKNKPNIIKINDVKKKSDILSKNRLDLKIYCDKKPKVILCTYNNDKSINEKKIKYKDNLNSKYPTIDLYKYILHFGNKKHPNNISFNDNTLYQAYISKFAPIVMLHKVTFGKVTGYQPHSYIINTENGFLPIDMKNWQSMENKPNRQHIYEITCRSASTKENRLEIFRNIFLLLLLCP